MADTPTYTTKSCSTNSCGTLRIELEASSSVAAPILKLYEQTYDSAGVLTEVVTTTGPLSSTGTYIVFEVTVTGDGAFRAELIDGSTVIHEWYELVICRALHCFKELAAIEAGKKPCTGCGKDDYKIVKAFIAAVIASFHMEISNETFNFFEVYKGINNLADICIKCGVCVCGCS